MKTTYLKTTPKEKINSPSYYKVIKEPGHLTSISVWNSRSLDCYTDEFIELEDYITLLSQSMGKAEEIEKSVFDEQYILLSKKLNRLINA